MLKKIYSRFSWKNSNPQQSVEVWDKPPTCETLKLSKFIDVIITGDLSHLGRLEDPEQAWQDIYSEYVEMSQDQQSSRALTLANQISYYTNRINITNEAVGYLMQRGYVAEICDGLKQMGYRLPFSENNLQADLNRVLSLSKSDHVKLQHATEQYNKIVKTDAAKVTKFDWYQILSALAKYRQVAVISPDNITVTEYVAMDLEFRAYVAAMKK